MTRLSFSFLVGSGFYPIERIIGIRVGGLIEVGVCTWEEIPLLARDASSFVSSMTCILWGGVYFEPPGGPAKQTFSNCNTRSGRA